MPDDSTPLTVLITGASRGLGAGLASRYAEQGFRLGLCARSEPLAPPGAPATVCASVDITDPEALEAFAHRCTDELGPIDVWINNAGVLAPIGPLRAAPVDELATHMQVNLAGTIWGSRIFAAMVHDRDEPGTLINISSGASRSAYAGWSVYCATKAAVDHLTRVLDLEEHEHGLSAFSVAPGVVDTDMQALIRATPEERFVHVDRFIEIHETDAFNPPEWIADHLLQLHRERPDDPLPGWFNSNADPVVVRIPDRPRG